MRTVGWNILVLSFASLASAQVPKECSAPPEYPHTRLASKYVNIQKFGDKEKVYYDCAEDFTASRGIRAVQCKNGEWSKLTLKCEKKTCGNAGDLPNGHFEYEGNLFLGEKVYAICNEGYTVKGLPYMVCKKTGWTGEYPTCEEGEPTCSTPAVANSVSSGGDVSVYQMGDNVTFTCSRGFQLDGAQLITCGVGGKWQPQPPRCLPAPAKTPLPGKEADGRCGVPENIRNSNANLADKYITKTSFASGDRVHYVCDVGYIQAGGSRYRSCNEGQWSRLLLRCERKPCGSAGEILNGQFEYTGVEFGDTATAVCSEGYRLVGEATRNCMSQGWDGRVPDCEPVDCREPPEVKNAYMRGRQEPPYTYASVVRYECRVGALERKEIWCTEDGTWSDLPPTCEETTCPPPKVYNAFWAGPRKEAYQIRDSLSINCYRGYTLTGARTITCGRDGQWSPDLPACKRMSYRTNWRPRYAN